MLCKKFVKCNLYCVNQWRNGSVPYLEIKVAVVEGSDLRAVTTLISNVYPCTVLAYSINYLDRALPISPVYSIPVAYSCVWRVYPVNAGALRGQGKSSSATKRAMLLFCVERMT
jgi:hypothetical protein